MRPVLMLVAIPVLLQIAWVIAIDAAPARVQEAGRVFNGYWPELFCAVPGCVYLIRRLRGWWSALVVLYLPVAMITLFFVAILTGAALSGE